MCEKHILAEIRVDESTWALTQLLAEGYDTVRWVQNDRYDIDSVCADLDGMVWTLEDFLAQTEYDAPIFSKSHVNCLCWLQVSHPNGAVVNVNWSGVI